MALDRRPRAPARVGAQRKREPHDRMAKAGADDPTPHSGWTRTTMMRRSSPPIGRWHGPYHPDIAGDDATARMTLINIAFDTIGSAHDVSRGRYRRRDPGGRAGHRAKRGRDRRRRGCLPCGPSASWTSDATSAGSMGEIARVDPGYLAWLSERRAGRPYADETRLSLRRFGHRKEPAMQETHAER